MIGPTQVIMRRCPLWPHIHHLACPAPQLQTVLLGAGAMQQDASDVAHQGHDPAPKRRRAADGSPAPAGPQPHAAQQPHQPPEQLQPAGGAGGAGDAGGGRQLIKLPPGRLKWTSELHDRWAPLPGLVVWRWR
jgi:hypothetical protein